MSFSVGIVGLPNVGKSTLFKALTQKQVAIAPFPFTTIDPNVGIVAVPDDRLQKLAEVLKPGKITPTHIKFIDIAGLVRGAHQGQGLGNQFLSHIRECDAILQIVRCFPGENIEHVEKSVDPRRDVEIIKTEMIMKDLEIIERIYPKFESQAKTGTKENLKQFEAIQRIRDSLQKGIEIRELNLSPEEKAAIADLQPLTAKPTVFIFNTGQDSKTSCSIPEIGREKILALDLKLGQEVSELSEQERKEIGLESQLDAVILACYNILDLITFYTVAGGQEVRANTLARGATAPQAGGKIHTDFERKFIRAEIISCARLIEAQSWNEAREQGWIKTVGKEYIVQDGDVIEFRI